MRSTLILAALGAQAAALNIPALIASLGPAPDNDPRFKNWVPPGTGDVRSPCPGLNTLANHGFIHHNGKNMTIPHLLKGLAAGLNIAPDFTTVIGAGGILSGPNPSSLMFDLDQLDTHSHVIEHDASLSRQDTYFGDNHDFYQPNWNVVLNAYSGSNVTSYATSGKARYARFLNSQATNPTFTFGAKEFILAYGETALYTPAMSSPNSNGVARVDFVRSLFEQEKLPYNLGWRVSKTPISLETTGMGLLQTYLAYPKGLPIGLTVTAMSYKDVLELIAGGSPSLANLTQGISTYLGL